MQKLISLWISFVMMFVSFVPGFEPPKEAASSVRKTYPYVLVHGLMGWGRDEGINNDLPYWGATSCNLVDNINAEGYECYAASVGPLSSNWDRACELYAQLTGTRVDYGEAHAKQHGHARYGRTYTEPMFEGWGEKDENGLINKVNLIGHSFGGNTVRLLLGLLDEGAPEEVAASGSDVSPLFLGGKGDWVNALVTICSPNNGSTLAYIVTDLYLIDLALMVGYLWAGFFGRSIINGYFDFHLEQFGLTDIPGVSRSDVSTVSAIYKLMKTEYDNVGYDLSPDGTKALNDRIGMTDDVYYFSYAFTTTKQVPLLNTYVGIPSTLAILVPFAALMGAYSHNNATDFEIDESWLENDGLVNVISAEYPFDDPHTAYNPDSIQKGIWNVMPLSTGDHGNAIGIGVSEEQTMEYYNGMIQMIEALPVTN